jgi:hypothetical protein
MEYNLPTVSSFLGGTTDVILVVFLLGSINVSTLGVLHLSGTCIFFWMCLIVVGYGFIRVVMLEPQTMVFALIFLVVFLLVKVTPP